MPASTQRTLDVRYASGSGAKAEVAKGLVSNGRLELNEYLQSVSNPLVYAAGDTASAGPPLTPVSGHDGRVVAANILEGNFHKPDHRGVPSVAFTVLPIAPPWV
jgi:glutathione reductase (NADPH)